MFSVQEPSQRQPRRVFPAEQSCHQRSSRSAQPNSDLLCPPRAVLTVLSTTPGVRCVQILRCALRRGEAV